MNHAIRILSHFLQDWQFFIGLYGPDAFWISGTLEHRQVPLHMANGFLMQNNFPFQVSKKDFQVLIFIFPNILLNQEYEDTLINIWILSNLEYEKSIQKVFTTRLLLAVGKSIFLKDIKSEAYNFENRADILEGNINQSKYFLPLLL